MSDLISRADAICEVLVNDGIENIVDRINKLPSAEAVDCTDFINWLTEEVMDEEMWELNAVANGEIICRKLVKLGVLEVTEEPSYYIRPSADAYFTDVNKIAEWIPCSERLPKRDELVLVTYKTTDRIHLCRYLDDGSENPWWSYIDDCCAWNNVVLAWMPLPKPYKGGDTE